MFREGTHLLFRKQKPIQHFQHPEVIEFTLNER